MQCNESLNAKWRAILIRDIFIIAALVLLVELAAAFTPEQQMTLEGMNLRCQLCIAHEKAINGQNVTEFNNLVDIYNTWIRQHFAGVGAEALLMSKITSTNFTRATQTQQSKKLNLTEITPTNWPEVPQEQQLKTKKPNLTQTSYLTKTPFKESSDLSKFGRQRVRSLGSRTVPGAYLATNAAEQKMKNF